MPDLATALDEIRAHYADRASAVAPDVPRLLAAVEAVLAQHPVLHDAGGEPVCPSCSMQMGERIDPDRCFIRMAISIALLGEDGTDG